MRHRQIAVALIAFAMPAVALSGPKGDILVPRFTDDRIVVDGQIGDWPLFAYTEPARQPVFPEAHNADATDALGNHIRFEVDRVGYFAGPDCNGGACAIRNNGVSDFGSTIYFAYDSRAIYLLGVFIDDVVRGDRDSTRFGSDNQLNDGFEIFLDIYNDSDDNLAEDFNPPNINFDDRAPNIDDVQITFGVNDNYPSGARQHLNRAGQPQLLGGDGPGNAWDRFDDIIRDERNGPGGIYRDALSRFGANAAATRVEDLRLIGARNAELTEQPQQIYSGYVLETAIPFQFADLDGDGATDDDFVPRGPMGFNLFWNDTDEDGESHTADDNIMRFDFTQNTVAIEHFAPALFHGDAWAELIFSGPLGDYDLDGELGPEDLDRQAIQMLTNDSIGDLDGNGVTDIEDRLVWVKELQKSWLGDTNFDGKFDSSDIVAAFVFGRYEDDREASYVMGDWNGDNRFDSGDFVAAFAAGGYERGFRSVAAVPEPSGLAYPIGLLIGWLAHYGRRSSNLGTRKVASTR